MHSWPIMVESMSATNSLLRREASGCTTTSTGRPASVARNRSAIALSFSPPGVKGISTATPGSKMRGACAVASTLTAMVIAASSSVGRLGLEIRVAT